MATKTRKEKMTNARRIALLDQRLRKITRNSPHDLRPTLEWTLAADLRRLANFNRLVIGYVGGKRFEFEDALAAYYHHFSNTH